MSLPPLRFAAPAALAALALGLASATVAAPAATAAIAASSATSTAGSAQAAPAGSTDNTFATTTAAASSPAALLGAAPSVSTNSTPVATESTPPSATTTASNQPAARVQAAPVINEVESNGDDTDWVELGNPGAEPLDLSGFVLTDSEPAKKGHAYTLPAGTTIAPGQLLVIDQVQGTRPGFDFGLGSDDAIRLYAPGSDVTAAGTTPVVQYSWGPHASVTYGRCPDLTGAFTDTTRSTKGAPNDCSTPFVLNEIESDGGDPDDWIELYNAGAAAASPNGLTLTDSEPNKAGHSYTIAGKEAIPAGGFLRLDTAEFGFGLGKADAVRLLNADGTVADEYAWTAHASTSYGRCPDGAGAFVTTSAPTPGAANDCGDTQGPAAKAWPGGDSVRTLDAADDTRGDWSGIDQEIGTPGAPGGLWVVQNGDGELYRLDSRDGGSTWERTRGWELRYPDGTGTVDAEGVTVTDAGSAAGVFVSSERNNDVKGVSRPAVLRFDLPGDATGSAPVASQPGTPVLKASAEWNLAADFPGLGANAGLEGVTWIPDSWLTKQGIEDQSTGSAYVPSTYPGHGAGLFAVAVEGTGHIYLYALMDSGAFQRVADIPTGFDVIADVQFDAERDQLWAVCDDACNGRIAVLTPQKVVSPTPVAVRFAVDAALPDDALTAFQPSALFERPAQSANFGNEGFVASDLSQCTDGKVPTYYVDDNNTDGHSLRTGTLDAVCPDPVEPTETPGSSEAPSPSPETSAPTSPSSTAPSTTVPSATVGPTGTSPSPDASSEPTNPGASSDPASPSSSDSPENEAQPETTTESVPAGGNANDSDHLAATGVLAVPWLAAAAALTVLGGAALSTRRRKH